MTAADVSVVTEALPGSQVGLTIEVPTDQVDRTFDRVLARLSQRIRIEGFRPGKAPRPLVEARLGPAAIREEVADALVSPVVNQALRDRSIEAIEAPRVEIQELERGRPARFTARVSVMPEVKLPDLDSLTVERRRTEVDDQMVEERLTALRERLAQIQPVDRPVAVGDIVVADVKILADGQEVGGEGGAAQEIEVVESRVIPELLAALPGHVVGDVVEADLTFPEEHPNPALAGKPGRLQATVQGVKEKQVPELTDEVASELSDGEQDSAEKLRQAVREDLEQQAARLDRLSFEQAAVDAVVTAAEVEVPEALVEREITQQSRRLERRLGERGLRLDRYLEYLKKSEDEYRAELRPEAEARIRVDLVLEELGKQLAIEPSEDEVTAHMRSEAEKDAEMGQSLDALLQNSVARGYFRHRLTRLQVLEALVARLTPAGPDGPPPPARGGEGGRALGVNAE
jgi:trigger factor